jgi:peptidoglycan lytic transglycosylase
MEPQMEVAYPTMARATPAMVCAAICLSSCAAPDLPPASHATPAHGADPVVAPRPADPNDQVRTPAPSHDATPSHDDRALRERYGALPALRVYRGQATFYGNSFEGRSTASGEPFDPLAFTAAHRTLPFGTVVRVVCPASHQVVYVTINDRGPFGSRRRIIDLSRAAAERLDILRLGVADVRVEVVELGRTKPLRRHR